MGLPKVEALPEEVDIVISAIRTDLSFLEAWRPIFQRYHLIIVQDVELNSDPQVPLGFDYDLYAHQDRVRILGPELASSLRFTGHACRCFGFLVSKKKYIFSIDDDCVPAKDSDGNLVNVLEQHITNLKQPATPFYFNTLYDPFREGADFVRGYPFSLREGVPTAISHGLWLNVSDYDSPTRILKPGDRNNNFVDAVLTVPRASLFPMSGINIAFDKEIIGKAMFFGLVKLTGGNPFFSRYDNLDDIWAGLCCKIICDHLGYGVKTGLPYVWRKDTGSPMLSLQRENKGVHLLEHIIPFFQSLRLPHTVVLVEDCYLYIASQVKVRLSSVDPFFQQLATSMEMWIQAWKAVSS
eukprot:c29473_g1_i1 orf=195-1253(+)